MTRVTKASRSKGIVWYRSPNGDLDSIWDLSPSQIDTILDMNDSLVAPYVMPGGFVDAVDAAAKRPMVNVMSHLQSKWPLTTGSSLTTSPMAGYVSANKTPDLFAVSDNGWVYRWQLPNEILFDTLFWPMTGYNEGRTFAYGGDKLPVLVTNKEPIRFFSYPNPTNGSKKAILRYAFSGPAKNVRLDIFSQTGFVVYSKKTMGNPPENLTGSYPDWNEHYVPLNKFGPGVYRCRLQATVGGKKYVKYWKMAVIK